jgi:hypothetical protein
MHRFVWDLRVPPPPVLEHEYPISAIAGDTPREPLGPFVPPGTYSVKLTVDGKVITRPLTVKMDPRVAMSDADLAAQFALLQRITEALARLDAGHVKTAGRRHRDRASLETALLGVYGIVESADDPPTTQLETAVEELEKRVDAALTAKADAR